MILILFIKLNKFVIQTKYCYKKMPVRLSILKSIVVACAYNDHWIQIHRMFRVKFFRFRFKIK
ncbi:hypothetical protein LH29_12270 [Draconibacterium sediminis]|uniref:Uncharacterized protein n=1 Tax=Draconibacterium sediminis TaxID=1544798 RepID=A0A0D8JA29_9BACT|nr:hypothetical protein LH29_12270 [Draconibacterium sediminis]